MNFKFGRKRPDPRARRLSFADYAGPSLPAPPDTVNWERKNDTLNKIFGNDRLGNCTAAGAGHVEGVWRAAAGNKDRMPTTKDVIEFYSATTGYVPGDPSTDQGGDEITVMNYWMNKGFFPDGSGEIACWLEVDATNPIQVKQAIWLSEILYFGVELPDAWVNPFPSGNGFVWDVAGPPNQNQGHCFIGLGYKGPSVKIATWGLIGGITWDAIRTYAVPEAGGALYCMFSKDAINRATQKAPNGFDFATLLRDSAGL